MRLPASYIIVGGQVLTENDRVTPRGTFNYAEAFQRAAEALRGPDELHKHNQAPIDFLYLQAIELYMKAFLRAHGVAADELEKKLLHNYIRLLSRCKTFGLHVERETEDALKRFTRERKQIRARYFRSSIIPQPDLNEVAKTVRSVRKAVRQGLAY